MIRTYGQTPKQLFERPHPMRLHQRPHSASTWTWETVTGLKWGNAVNIECVAFEGQLRPLFLVSSTKVLGLLKGQVYLNEDCIIGLCQGWAFNTLTKQRLRPLEYGSDKVTKLASCDGKTVWVGYQSGKLTAFDLFGTVKSAFGHSEAVNDISPSQEWSLVVTASEDKTSLIWDTVACNDGSSSLRCGWVT